VSDDPGDSSNQYTNQFEFTKMGHAVNFGMNFTEGITLLIAVLDRSVEKQVFQQLLWQQ